MPQNDLEWVIVSSAYGSSHDIGAVGFIGNTAVVAVAFYEDADWNQDGKLSKVERFGRFIPVVGSLFFKEGRALTEVVMAARGESDIMLRDPSFGVEAAKQFLDFSTSLVFSGLYAVYFSRSVKALTKGTAQSMTDSVVKQYVIRKGMEKSVKTAYDAAVKAGKAFR